MKAPEPWYLPDRPGRFSLTQYCVNRTVTKQQNRSNFEIRMII